jgi:hypothetical protein
MLEPTSQTGVYQMATASPRRGRMIEDMAVRNLSPATQLSYLSAVLSARSRRASCRRAFHRLPRKRHKQVGSDRYES